MITLNENTALLLFWLLTGASVLLLTCIVAIIVVARNSKARYKAMSHLIDYWQKEIKEHRKLAIKDSDAISEKYNYLNEKVAGIDLLVMGILRERQREQQTRQGEQQTKREIQMIEITSKNKIDEVKLKGELAKLEQPKKSAPNKSVKKKSIKNK